MDVQRNNLERMVASIDRCVDIYDNIRRINREIDETNAVIDSWKAKREQERQTYLNTRRI